MIFETMNIRARYFSSIEEAERAFENIGCDLAGIKIMNEKAVFWTLHLKNISLRAAIILKQEMMALGGEVVQSKEVMTLTPEKTDALLLGTQKQYRKLIQKLYQQPFGCKEIAAQLHAFVERQKISPATKQWQLGKTTLDFSKPLLMGIVNITPDSFSDGSKYLDPATALQHCRQLIAEGADLLDLGAESSRPGSEPVSVEEELHRLLPVLDALLQNPSITVPISVDTSKPVVAEACLKRGVHMINDITGLQNPAMQDCVAEYNVPVIIMHMQGTPKTMQENPQYSNVVDDIITFFETQIAQCEKKGITKIILDPGIGFGKTLAQNLEILRRLKEFQILGKPLLIGTSRKSFIQKMIGGIPDDRLEGTIATNVLAALYGTHIFRVHDVKACKRALDLTAQILQGERTWKEQSS